MSIAEDEAFSKFGFIELDDGNGDGPGHTGAVEFATGG